MRFEKSLDPENTIRGLARAVELFGQFCPGIRVVGGITDNRGSFAAHPPDCSFHELRRSQARERGQSGNAWSAYLHALGFEARETAPGVLTVTVPTWRATKDISLKDDLVEEIGRMVGYDHDRAHPPLVASVAPPANPTRIYLRKLRSQIAAQGFTEVYNYSFVNEEEVKRFKQDIRESGRRQKSHRVRSHTPAPQSLAGTIQKHRRECPALSGVPALRNRGRDPSPIGVRSAQ